MKKTFIVCMLLAASGLAVSKSFADSAWDQAQDVDYYSNQAAHSSSDEDARATSGCGFDTSCGSSSTVDLSGAGDHPTPQLLRTSDDNDNPYIPQQYRSLHTTPPPMP